MATKQLAFYPLPVWLGGVYQTTPISLMGVACMPKAIGIEFLSLPQRGTFIVEKAEVGQSEQWLFSIVYNHDQYNLPPQHYAGK